MNRSGDREAVEALLGRPPRGAFEVVVRHPDGSPVVICNAPLLDDGTPMPTRWWLVGEPERTWVGRLEAASGVARAEAAVPPALVADAHARYAAERDRALPPGHTGPRPSGGVGGTRRGVKCLHAHYAWWLAGGDDPVGAWVADQLAATGSISTSDGRTPPGVAAPVVAAVDCGTNSTRLLIVRGGPEGTPQTLAREMRITRLGEAVDATGHLDPSAIARTLEVLTVYRELMDRHGVSAVRLTATSAARDADNRDDFFGPAAAVTGAEPELLSGAEEAALSFAGAMAELTDRPGRHLVLDVGGGSTELAAGTVGDDGTVRLTGATSVDLGCVRVTERFLHADPPTVDELAAAHAHCAAVLGPALDGVRGARDAQILVGLAGTVSTLAAIDQGLEHHDRERLHHHRLSTSRIREWTDRLAAITPAERARIPGMEPGRVGVIVGGAVVLLAVLEALGIDELLTSEADILDGLAASLFR